MTTKVNYTDAMVATAVEMYNELGNEGVDKIAETLGRSVRSVRSKLVREGVYVAPVKVTKTKVDTGPTKKEMLNTLEGLVDFDVEGLMGANKDAIQALIDTFGTIAVDESEVA